jgi:hypothetical protein
VPATRSYLKQERCADGIRTCPGVVNIGQNLLGAPALAQYLTQFDRANARIGFAPQKGCQ